MNPRPETSVRTACPAAIFLLLLLGMVAAGRARAAIPPRGPSWANVLPPPEASARSEVEWLLGRSIHVAVAEGDAEGVSTLLARRPSMPESRDSGGFTPLHVAILAGRVEVVNGVTPLHISAFLGNAGIAARLVARCADINARELEGLTARAFAERKRNREVEERILSGPGEGASVAVSLPASSCRQGG